MEKMIMFVLDSQHLYTHKKRPSVRQDTHTRTPTACLQLSTFSVSVSVPQGFRIFYKERDRKKAHRLFFHATDKEEDSRNYSSHVSLCVFAISSENFANKRLIKSAFEKYTKSAIV